MRRTTVLLLAALAVAGPARGQWSGAVSASAGYNSHPLYNYEMTGDHLTQGYLNLHYADQARPTLFGADYTGGLMVFHTLADRTYYEHSLSARWDRPYGRPAAKPQPSESEDAGEEEVPAGTIPDTLFSLLTYGLKGSARHDHEAYNYYDNLGFEGAVAYRFPAGSRMFCRTGTVGGYRWYTHFSEESNFHDVSWIELGIPFDRSTVAGVAASFGVKHFTQAGYDTSRVDTQVPVSQSKGGSGGNRGKGKGSGSASGNGKGNQKALLINPTSLTVLHAGLELSLRHLWVSGSIDARLRYDVAPSSKGRYVAQYPSSTVLYEDIYNDFFSYGGFSGEVTVHRSLPLRLQGTVMAVFARKNYVAPALDLTGASLLVDRADLRGGLVVTVSRYVELSESVGLDLTVTGELLRNQSNDAYNDYSLQSIMVGVGLGF